MAMAISAISSVDSATISTVKTRSLPYRSSAFAKWASVNPPPAVRNAPTADRSSGTTKKMPTTSNAGATSASAAQRRSPPGPVWIIASSTSVAIGSPSVHGQRALLQHHALVAFDDVGEVIGQRERAALAREIRRRDV